MLLAYARRLTGSAATAEDILQETLLRAWRHRDALDGNVRSWLLTVTRNLAIDRARAAAIRPVEVAAVAHRPPVQPDHAEPLVRSLDLVRAVRKLPDKHREVLVQLYYRDRTPEEAARELGIPTGTVKSRAHHALRALRVTFGATIAGGSA